MLGSKELNTCIELLAEINSRTEDRVIRTKALEIGYILKEELDNMTLVESMSNDVRHRENNMDTKRLLEDNIQLFNEKEKVLKQNRELKMLLDQKLMVFEEKTAFLTDEIRKFNTKLESV